ncbi:hypothetical protein BC835DRAFT_1419973 [Cytidiella melzeri]|nr:hypothetical protein BC835DRAFT_1419973 [Cytidiella melzeri]
MHSYRNYTPRRSPSVFSQEHSGSSPPPLSTAESCSSFSLNNSHVSSYPSMPGMYGPGALWPETPQRKTLPSDHTRDVIGTGPPFATLAMSHQQLYDMVAGETRRISMQVTNLTSTLEEVIAQYGTSTASNNHAQTSHHAAGEGPMQPELNRAQYPNTRFWTKEEWFEYRSKNKDRNRTQDDKQNLVLGFLTDTDGSQVDSSTLPAIRQAAFMMFRTMATNSAVGLPVTWARGRDTVQLEQFCKNMESKFPILCLCAHHWKADSLAIELFSHFDRDKALQAAGHHLKRKLECGDSNSVLPLLADGLSDAVHCQLPSTRPCQRGKKAKIAESTGFVHNPLDGDLFGDAEAVSSDAIGSAIEVMSNAAVVSMQSAQQVSESLLPATSPTLPATSLTPSTTLSTLPAALPTPFAVSPLVQVAASSISPAASPALSTPQATFETPAGSDPPALPSLLLPVTAMPATTTSSPPEHAVRPQEGQTSQTVLGLGGSSSTNATQAPLPDPTNTAQAADNTPRATLVSSLLLSKFKSHTGFLAGKRWKENHSSGSSAEFATYWKSLSDATKTALSHEIKQMKKASRTLFQQNA